jgi:hypothetical protein
MAIPESGFITNVNTVANNIETIAEAAALFDQTTVDTLNEIISLDITQIVEDLKKSNYLGNRKLDINLALNNLSTVSPVSYSQARLLLKDGTSLTIPFQVLSAGNLVTLELTSHADIKNYIQNSNEFISSVINTELTVEDAIGNNPQVIRFRDSDGASSNLDRVDLTAYSGSYINGIAQYTWADTTSSLQTLANRASEILLLGQSIDSIIALSNLPTEIQSLYTNMSNIINVNNTIIPNIVEILATDTNAANALLSANQASDSASSASTHAGNAATSATTAQGYLLQFSNLTANAATLITGSSATASYNPSTGVLSLGIPQGAKGDKGDAFAVNAFGTLAGKSAYDTQALGFSYLAVDTSNLYFKQSATSGDWSAGVPFGKGDTGAQGVQGFSWLTGTGVPSVGTGVNGDLYLNTANSDVYTKSGGVWGSPITNLSAGINDTTTSSALTWSSTKITTELGLKSSTTHDHNTLYEAKNVNIQSHISATNNPHSTTKAQVGLGNVDNTSNATERTAVATLTNKTIVVANNTITTAASGNLVATDLNSALAELQSDIDSRATSAALTTHTGMVIAAHAASAISSIASGNLAATTVQNALNELQSDIDTRATGTDLTNHINDTADAHDASAISYAGGTGMAATDVEAAIDELANEKISKTSSTGSAVLPVGTTAQRDGTPQAGYIRYNTTIPSFEGYTGTEWGTIGGAGGGSGATGGGTGNLQDLIFVENDTLVTNDYILGQGAQKTGATFTNGSANIGFTGHGFVAEQLVMFSTTGTLPTNFTAWAGYYVIPTGLTADVFQVSATKGGAAITAGSAGSGTHSTGKLKHASTVSLNVLTGKTVTIPTNVTLVVN